MESRKTIELFTEQGVGSPVPVGAEGVRAGLARSSTSDCAASSVGNQAEVQKKVTGTIEYGKEVKGLDSKSSDTTKDPFEKRPLLSRSPPFLRRGSTGCISDVIDNDSRKEEFEKMGSSSKRPREEEILSDDVHDLKNRLDKLEKTSVELRNLVKTIPNTKTDIKKMIESIFIQVDTMKKKVC